MSNIYKVIEGTVLKATGLPDLISAAILTTSPDYKSFEKLLKNCPEELIHNAALELKLDNSSIKKLIFVDGWPPIYRGDVIKAYIKNHELNEIELTGRIELLSRKGKKEIIAIYQSNYDYL